MSRVIRITPHVEHRLTALRLEGETLGDTITRILNRYEGNQCGECGKIMDTGRAADASHGSSCTACMSDAGDPNCMEAMRGEAR